MKNKIEYVTQYAMQRMAELTFDGVNLLNDGWKFKINNRITRSFGHCNYTTKEIVIAGKLLPSLTIEEIHDTINHEIAHAFAGFKADHGPVWQEWAIRLGATPTPSAKTVNTPEFKKKWAIVFYNKHGKLEFVSYRTTRRMNLKNKCLAGREKETHGKMFFIEGSKIKK